MTMRESDFHCAGCGVTFPNDLPTRAAKQYVTPTGESEERVFHSSECAAGWAKRRAELDRAEDY
jgi:hypothetical protein